MLLGDSEDGRSSFRTVANRVDDEDGIIVVRRASPEALVVDETCFFAVAEGKADVLCACGVAAGAEDEGNVDEENNFPFWLKGKALGRPGVEGTACESVSPFPPDVAILLLSFIEESFSRAAAPGSSRSMRTTVCNKTYNIRKQH